SVWLDFNLRGDGRRFQGSKGIGDLVFRRETALRHIEFSHHRLEGYNLRQLLPNLSVPAVLQEIWHRDSCGYASHSNSPHTTTNEEDFQGIALIRRLQRQPVCT